MTRNDLEESLRRGTPVLAVGLMSGTSADGIDAALVEIHRPADRPRLELKAFQTEPYPDDVRALLFRCFENETTVREVCLLNQTLGELFAVAAERILAGSGVPPEHLGFVASHGQTVWHEPPGPAGRAVRGTLQIAEAAVIAERLQVPVVSDFRQQDLAAGGQGAPLVPYADYLLFADPAENRAIQNIGGIANVTYLPAGGTPADVVAFDTGPGNVLIDAAVRLVTEGAQRFDRDGIIAASAQPDGVLLAELLRHPYFHDPPPKSTGRERFGDALVRSLWDRGCRGAALVSTMTELTVRSIARSYRAWLGPVDVAVLGGGGARNRELVRRLARALAPWRVTRHEEFGLNSDAKEAIAFALLGYETLRGRSSNLPRATGAARPVLLGKVCWP